MYVFRNLGTGMENGKWEIRGKPRYRYRTFHGLDMAFVGFNAVAGNVRASPDIAKFPSHIRKAPEYTTILIYYRKLYTQYCTRIKNNHHFATQ